METHLLTAEGSGVGRVFDPLVLRCQGGSQTRPTLRLSRSRMHAGGAMLALVLAVPGMLSAMSPVDIGSRLELFVDRHLVDRLDNARLRLGQPQPREIALRFNEPWEMPFAGCLSVIKDGGVYRMYYRGAGANAKGDYDPNAEVTCYAESPDGIHWTKPSLGLHEFRGSKDNNIIMGADVKRRISATFAPFLDDRPGVPADERYKGVGGQGGDRTIAMGPDGRGLFRLASPDGIHWRVLPGPSLFQGYALDTLNVAFWSPAEQTYVAYIRTWSEGGTPDRPKFAGYRTISRSVSKDFVTWSEPKQMSFGDAPTEQVYTIGAHPYFRAPHLIIALPFRFNPGKNVLTVEEAQAFGLVSLPGEKTGGLHGTPLGKLGAGHALGGLSDAVLMSSRGGYAFDRTFMESFIRPGLNRHAWTARSNVPAFGVLATGENEISVYLQTGYTSNDYHIRRYTLRTDGFASVNAPFAGGTMLTKPLVFAGKRLVLNYSTSSVGSVKVELTDEGGKPLPGFSLTDCDEIIGDEISRTVSWKTATDLSAIAGRPVRLRFSLKDADLYSIQFPE